MTPRIEFRPNRVGIGKLLKLPAVERHLVRTADRVAAAAGPGHRVESAIGPNRARAAVITDTTGARRAEAKDRNLTRALLSVRSR